MEEGFEIMQLKDFIQHCKAQAAQVRGDRFPRPEFLAGQLSTKPSMAKACSVADSH